MSSRLGARSPWPPILWVATAATIMVTVDLGRRILATNDEARFPVLARDILLRGSWFSPQLNGAVYHNKPPLYAWLVALCSWPGGRVTQLTAVLPSALAGIGTALVVYAIGRSMFGANAGRLAALVTISTQGWFLHSRLPMPDMLMTFFITASLSMFWPMVRGRSGPCWAGFYGCIGAAFWAKGAGGLMPLVVALAYAAATFRRGRWRDLHLPAGLALVALVIAPWWLMEFFADPGALRNAVVSDNLLWYLPRSATGVLTGPPLHVLGILFPWALLIPAVAFHAVRFLRSRGEEHEAVFVLLLWAAVLLACVGLSGQQRFRYYLPLVPPVSLLIAWWWAGAMVKQRPVREIPWRAYGAAAGLLALATGLVIAIRGARPTDALSLPVPAVWVLLMGGALLVMVGALVYGVRRARLAQAFVAAWIGSAVWVIGWYHWELERRNAAYDYPLVRVETGRMLPEAPVVAAWGVNELPFSFYFDRRVVAIDTDRDLRRIIFQHPRGSAVLSEGALARVENRAGLRILRLRRLASDPIVLVTPEVSPPRAQP